jgi:hypothetical protein
MKGRPVWAFWSQAVLDFRSMGPNMGPTLSDCMDVRGARRTKKPAFSYEDTRVSGLCWTSLEVFLVPGPEPQNALKPAWMLEFRFYCSTHGCKHGYKRLSIVFSIDNYK